MTPHIGILPLLLAFAAGACAIAGLYHLMVGVTRTGDRVHRSFAALSLLTAIWILIGVFKFAGTDPEAVADAMNIRITVGHLMGLASVWFFTYFAGRRPGVVQWVLTALPLGYVGLNLLSPRPVYFTGPAELTFLELPWGETMTTATGPFGWGYVAEFAVSIPVGFFVLWAGAQIWWSGRGRLPLLATAIVVAGFVLSIAAFGVALPTAELGYLVLIVLMGLSLSDEAVETRGALSQTKERLRAVVESAPEAILLLNMETGRATLANQNAMELFGLAEADVPEFHPLDWAPSEQADVSPSVSVFDRRWVSALAGNRSSFPWLIRDASGELISTEALMVRLPGEVAPLIRLSLVDQRNLEAAEAHGARLEEQLRQSLKLEAVGRLTGGVAHDFNNFLTVMRGSLELLVEDDVEPEEQEVLIQEALSAADRSAALTQRLLAFSRRQPLAPRPIDMHRIVDRSGTLLRRTLGEHILIDYDVPKDVWPIEADPTQLESALVNLAINAADAMETGGRLTIGARNVFLEDDDYEFLDQLSPGEYVRIHVSDTGHGMDKATQSRVIEPFFTTKEVGKGTGLGLSMVYGFATQSGGTMKIESEPTKGTSVFLYFPRMEGAPVEALAVP